MKSKEEVLDELRRHQKDTKGLVASVYDDCIDLVAEIREPEADAQMIARIQGELETLAYLTEDPVSSMLLRIRDQLQEADR